jgi:hypothetical protein
MPSPDLSQEQIVRLQIYCRTGECSIDAAARELTKNRRSLICVRGERNKAWKALSRLVPPAGRKFSPRPPESQKQEKTDSDNQARKRVPFPRSA